jgi:hypothetical protein
MAEDDYNYKKAYLREKSARDQLETLLEDKTRALFIANQELEEKLETVKNQQITLMQSEKNGHIRHTFCWHGSRNK